MDIHGMGSFGKVAKCFSLDHAEMVAIKFLNADDENISQEVDMLKAISVLDSDKKNIVKFIDSFKYNHLFCLVFEMLDESIFDLMGKRIWLPLSLNEIRPVLHQLLVSLEALKGLGIIHGDLKLDNLMLVNHKDHPFKLRVIDFGLAIPASEAEIGHLVQNPLFRAPEVMLGLPLTEAVDIWSMGCIMMLLFLVDTPFPFDCSYGWMENLVDLLGQPADHVLAAGEYSKDFFILDKSGWRLMTREEFTNKSNEEPETDKSGYISFKKNLKKKRISDKQDKLKFQDKMAFFDLLKCCLKVDPEQRISPSEALKHPFITMVHMVDEMETSSYADTALELMIVSPLDNLDESTFNTVTSEESTSISSNTGSAAAITPVDDDVNKSSHKPFKKKLFQRVKNFFCRVAKRVVRPFKFCMTK
ncbi:unnamed protein product [Pleuronectes platessa]|uniref:Protein kinase domain-containing protein n=1 Tax=Pleuronectes platessa TaxID=8262 RepID=A0A9N7Z3B2_PLEPL|nr:unnamed protein product [Pleuronectes platessa]